MSIYKGNKLVAGGSIDTHFVRRPAWDQAIAISIADLTAGYKAPADGMIVGALYNKVDGSHYFLTLNGTNLMPLLSITGAYDKATRPLMLSLTVNQGDIIGCTAPIANIGVFPSIKFVPFEDSTVSDIEVVTPEYIRNQNILSDLESITISTSSSSPTVMPYDGVIYISYKTSGSTAGRYYLNGQQVLWFEGAYEVAANSGTLTVKKGDTVYVKFNNAYPSAFARFYKLRDYTGR